MQFETVVLKATSLRSTLSLARSSLGRLNFEIRGRIRQSCLFDRRERFRSAAILKTLATGSGSLIDRHEAQLMFPFTKPEKHSQRRAGIMASTPVGSVGVERFPQGNLNDGKFL